MVYVPVLKGKAGEFYALAHTSPTVRRHIRPVMELVPDDQVRDLLETFCDHAMNYVPNHMVLTVDCGALSPRACSKETWAARSRGSVRRWDSGTGPCAPSSGRPTGRTC
ncbi:hypothetical protein ACFQVA_29725 [Actinomadura keratinilytica]